MKRLNQKDLAQRLGVSQSVVSGVLNGNPSIRVGKEKREKILEAIREANYQPNRLANALLDRETKTVGVIYQGGYVQLGIRKVDAVVRSLTQRGYLPLVYDLLLDMKGDEQCQLLCDFNVKGAIFINAAEPFMYDIYPRCLKGRLNIASIDSPWNPGICQIYSDRVQGFSILTEHLLRRGYRKIAVLMSSMHPQTRDSPYTHAYGLLRGVGETLDKVGLKPAGVEVYDSELGGAACWHDPYLPGRISMGKLLDKGCRPDAVICSSDPWAIGAMHECSRRGMRVPEDLAIVGFNDDVQAQYAMSPLTTVSPPVDELAEAAVRHIVESSFEPDHPPKEEAITILPCSLVVRSSCGTGSVPLSVQ